VIGVALCSVAVIFFAFTLPTIFGPPCLKVKGGGIICTIPPPSHEVELTLAIFGIAIAIAGVGLLVLHNQEKPRLRQA
jgi:hypothetical protein